MGTFRATNFPFTQGTEDGETSLGYGGRCIRAVAHETLKIGDVVYWTPGGRIGKSLESSLYAARFAGVVVGGKNTDMLATTESVDFQESCAAKGENVLIQVAGVAKVVADATTVIRFGDPISSGRTTAGRVRPDMLYSVATTAPGLAIGTVSNLVAKAVNVTQTIVAGIAGTATAANLAQATLSGTVANAKFNVYVLRIAADGTTVTSAMGTDGATLNDVVWPAGSVTTAALGYIIINPTGTGGFVGGTTALDDATVIPNAKYVDLVRTRLAIGYSMESVTPAAGDAIKILLV